MEPFDYVIVGAGSAGCVLANRLSADPRTRVLLLEAGGSDRRFWVRVPIGYARTYRDPRVNWMYQSQAEPALDGRNSYWPRGKLLGGSGSINAMAYVRGQPEDFDHWQRLGNPGWGWDEVLPFFKRSEDHVFGASVHHGAGGPLHVTDITAQVHPLCQSFTRAAQALGYGVTDDFNGDVKEGVGIREVIENSPAANAGLKAGDVVLEVEGKPVKEPASLQRTIGSFKPRKASRPLSCAE